MAHSPEYRDAELRHTSMAARLRAGARQGSTDARATPAARAMSRALAGLWGTIGCATPAEAPATLARALDLVADALQAMAPAATIVSWPVRAHPIARRTAGLVPRCIPLERRSARARSATELDAARLAAVLSAPAPPYVHAVRWRELGGGETTLPLVSPGIAHRLVAIVPVSRRAQVVVTFDRPRGALPFDDDDRGELAHVMASLARITRDAALLRGIVSPLSPREARALLELLGGAPEKLLADAMGVSPASMHQIVVAVYRKLGVSSRAELMSLFLAPPSTLPSAASVSTPHSLTFHPGSATARGR